jgi:hypothetical protein
MRRALSRYMLLIGLLVPVSCGSEGEGGGIHEISETRQCRANMNSLSTEMAGYCYCNGDWASSPEQLDCYSGRMRPLTCPQSGLDYVITTDEDDGYIIECPSGHGSISTGRRSWSDRGGT